MNIKYVLVFASGALIGAGATYIFLKESFQAKADKDAEDIRNFYRQKEEDHDMVEDLKEDDFKTLERYAEEDAEGVYDFYKQKEEDEENDSDELYPSDDDEKEEDLIENRTDPPKIVDEEEFWYYARDDGFETLTYYVGDHTLCDENEEIVQKDLVGEENIGKISSLGTENVLYIRNPRLSMNYEVMFSPHSYKTVVLGMDFEEKQAKKSQTKKLKRVKEEFDE